MNEVVKGILDWLLEIAKIAIPAIVTIVTYKKMTASQDPKLDSIERATNGNLDEQKKKAERYEAQLRANGITPE